MSIASSSAERTGSREAPLAAVFGCAGPVLTVRERDFFRDADPFGFILFEPLGIHGRIAKWKLYFELFPFYRRDMFRRQKSYLKTERLR